MGRGRLGEMQYAGRGAGRVFQARREHVRKPTDERIWHFQGNMLSGEMLYLRK